MSTDYGFGCATCGLDGELRYVWHDIIENCREPAVLQRWIAGGCDLMEALRLVDEESHWHGLSRTIQDVVAHRALGHEVIVIDGYYRRVDRCPWWRTCPGCGSHREQCELEEGHVGDCALKDGRTWSEKSEQGRQKWFSTSWEVYREAVKLLATPGAPLDGLRAAVEACQRVHNL